MTESKKTPASLDDIVSAIEKLQNSLDEVSMWQKISGVEKVKEVLERALDKPEKILVYHLSTDDKTTREINNITGVSRVSISSYQKSWFNLGLMKKVPTSSKERYVKNFNLEDFGIKIPEIKLTNNQLKKRSGKK